MNVGQKPKVTGFDRALGTVLASHRKMAGLTQQNVANELEYHSTSISFFETGKVSFNVNQLYRYCELLGVSIARVMADAERLYRQYR